MSRAREFADLAGSAEAGGITGSNIITNGAMQVAQRSASASVSTSVTYATLDRWQFSYGDDSSNEFSTYTMSQDSDAPSGFANSMKFICTTAASAPSANTAALVQQKFEGQDVQQIQFATSGAKVLTASFYVKSNQTGNIGVQLFAEDDQTMNSQLISIDTANTWEFKTVTFAAKTSGTQIPDDNTVGFRLRFVFEYNTGRAFGTANTWAAKQTDSQLVPAGTSARTSSLNDTFFLAGVQLEVGEQATPFEHRSYADELAKCQRYYTDIVRADNQTAHLVGYVQTSTVARFGFHVSMRTTPTISETNFGILYGVGNEEAITSIDDISQDEQFLSFRANVSGNLTAGQAVALYSNGAASLAFDAEL